MREDVRREARTIIRNMNKESVIRNSEIIKDKVIGYIDGYSVQGDTKKAFVYNSYGNEVMTEDIISFLIDNGYNVYLPIVRGNDMFAVHIDKNTKYVVGDYGIIEPIGEIYDGEFDIIITPLLAFDEELNRMGKGKGYYDRFFAMHKSGKKIGLAHSCQMFTSVYPEPHDIRMDVIITEERIHENNSGKI